MIKDFELEARQRDLRMLRYLFDRQRHYDIPSRDLYMGCHMSSSTFSRLKHRADANNTKGGSGVYHSRWNASPAA